MLEKHRLSILSLSYFKHNKTVVFLKANNYPDKLSIPDVENVEFYISSYGNKCAYNISINNCTYTQTHTPLARRGWKIQIQ